MSDISQARRPFAALAETLRWGTKAHDLVAIVPLVAWYGLTLIVTIKALEQQLTGFSLARPDLVLVLTILSKLAVLLIATVIVGLLIFRLPPRSGARGFLPRAAALLGTYLSVGIAMLHPAHLPVSMLALSTALILGGTAFAINALLHLGRSFSLVAEARKLVTSGPYSMVRHPLYLGEEVAIFGMAIQFFSPLAGLLLALQIACQIYRMGREEDVLTQAFPDYRDYKARTFRVVPGLY
jgi:protein-S-isoprenylcysteine O-methyltransferase Ste14